MVCKYIRNLLSIASLLLVGLNCAFMNCMDEEGQSPNLPVLDRAFFGFTCRASVSYYCDCLRLFVQALAAQERLVRTTEALIQIEAQIQRIDKEWNSYYDTHLRSILAKDALDPFNRERIQQYLRNSILVYNASPRVPIIGTTPRANATILMYRNLIQSPHISKVNLRLISRLLQSDNDEVKAIGYFLRYKVFIDCKNAKHDSISDQHERALTQMQDCLASLSQLKCTFSDKFIFSGKALLERENTTKQVLRSMLDIKVLTKGQCDRITAQTHEFQQSIIDKYQQRKQELDQLYVSIVEKLQEMSQLTSHKAKENKKKKSETRGARATFHEDAVPCALDSGLANIGSDEIDELGHVCYINEAGESACMGNMSIVEDELPDPSISAVSNAPAHVQEQPDVAAAHHDEYISAEESCPEYTVIYDRRNNMRICLYSSARTHPVDRDLVSTSLDYRTPLDYMRHIFDWFTNPEQELQNQGYTDHTSEKFVPEKDRFNIIRIHRFSRDVDRFIYEKGIQTSTPSRRVQGQDDICITIPGHVEFLDVPGHRQTCIFVYLIDSVTKRCYHRNIEYKLEYRLTQEFLEQGCFSVKLPPFEWAQK